MARLTGKSSNYPLDATLALKIALRRREFQKVKFECPWMPKKPRLTQSKIWISKMLLLRGMTGVIYKSKS